MRFFSSVGKRRSATSASIAGDIISATTNSATTTITGVASSTTTSGATAAFRPGPPALSSQPITVVAMGQDASVSRTASIAASQKK